MTHMCDYGYNCVSCHVAVAVTINCKILVLLEHKALLSSSVNSRSVQYKIIANVLGNDFLILIDSILGIQCL